MNHACGTVHFVPANVLNNGIETVVTESLKRNRAILAAQR